MKIRIISDIHRSINRNYPLSLKDNCDYTLIAGDLGPEFKKNANWIRKNVRKGAFVSGNHDAYDKDITIEEAKAFYHRTFPVDGDVSYLDASVGAISKSLSEKVLLVGDILYTDYAFPIAGLDEGLPEDQIVRNNIRRASPKMSGSYMNDFNYFTSDGSHAEDWEIDGTRGRKGAFYIRPEHYLEHFRKAFAAMTEIVESNPDKDVIVMTHHCLSPKCISDRFSKDTLNASYVSDKDAWIANHPNIRLVVSGHVHHRATFHVGDALYVLNPLGYCPYGENLSGENGEEWTPDLFVDTDTWTVSREEWKNPAWEKQYQSDTALFSIFG